MAVGYVSYAAPIATTPSTLGVTGQPVTTGGSITSGGNAAVSTGYDPTPVATATTSGGGASQNMTALANQLAAPGTSQQAVTAAANIATQQLQSASTGSTIGGGGLGDALKNGVSGIVAFAQKGMADIQKAIQGDMAANNGEVDPAKMQLYTMKMSTYELLNQMAAKIQEKEERSIQIWLR
jgi:hypothetical protein